MEPLEYLHALKREGYSCYIVGGYVRDKILGIDSFDVDIATSAKPWEVARVFSIPPHDDLGCTRIVDSPYTLDITTYRKEKSYVDRHPESVEYVSNIDEDLVRRDFTMNAICMDVDGKIYDPLGGLTDLKNGIIRVIGDVSTKFNEDPLRMLRALRFSIIYDLKIEKCAQEFIEKNATLLDRISYTRKKGELDKILLSNNSMGGLRLLENLGLSNILGITMPTDYREVKSLLGAWAQLEWSNYPFSKVETSRMKNISDILSRNTVDMNTLFLYGIDDNLIAGEIMNLDKDDIRALYDAMPIHSESELILNGRRIKEILGIEKDPIIKDIKKDLLRQVLSGNLPNSENELAHYIQEKWK